MASQDRSGHSRNTAGSCRHAALAVGADINEYTNDRIREYFPKGTEITGEMDYLRSVGDLLNDRPHATLGFTKLSELSSELLLQEAMIPGHELLR